MLEENKLDIVKARIDIMVKAMTMIDESKLSNASILMFINAFDVIATLTSDLFHSYICHIKKHGCNDMDIIRKNTELIEYITNGEEKLSEFMRRLANEVDVRELLLK